jgi:hypothetical protein
MARPQAVAADGNIRVAWCTTLTTSAPTAAQCTSGVDLSYYLTPDGLKPSVDQQSVTDDRLADAQTFDAPGRYKVTLDKLRYVFNPTSTPDNLAETALTNGATGFLVVRFGLAASAAYASTQKVDFYPLTIGFPIHQPPEANSVLHAEVQVFVTNSIGTNVALA